VTLLLPARLRPTATLWSRPVLAQAIEPHVTLPMSDLDRRMSALRRDHTQHVNGPVYPCPQCFHPELGWSF
jgi:hypothetical protein